MIGKVHMFKAVGIFHNVDRLFFVYENLAIGAAGSDTVPLAFVFLTGTLFYATFIALI